MVDSVVQPMRPPQLIFDIVNNLIRKKLHNDRAVISIKEIIQLLNKAGFEETTITDNRWLYIEPFYTTSEWRVTYSYTNDPNLTSQIKEAVEPCFIFDRKK